MHTWERMRSHLENCWPWQTLGLSNRMAKKKKKKAPIFSLFLKLAIFESLARKNLKSLLPIGIQGGACLFEMTGVCIMVILTEQKQI